jgi:ribosome-associated protein YbcJ (S4-like RNA binding protein)
MIWLLLACASVHAQNSQPTEYQIKAAFLFNFAKFVEWPPKAFGGESTPFVIGILGDNPFHDDLTRIIGNKTVDQHPLVVREYRSLDGVTNCHMLFISNSEKERLPEILALLKGSNVVSVGEMDQFTESGGMIKFALKENKIRFLINNEAAHRAGLKVSSKLLALALRPGA